MKKLVFMCLFWVPLLAAAQPLALLLPGGYAVCLRHTLPKSKQFVLKNAAGDSYQANYLATDSLNDMVLLKLSTVVAGLPKLALRTKPLAEGDGVQTLRLGADAPETGRSYPSKLPKLGFYNVTIANRTSQPGAPLFDHDGHLLGLLTDQDTNNEGWEKTSFVRPLSAEWLAAQGVKSDTDIQNQSVLAWQQAICTLSANAASLTSSSTSSSTIANTKTQPTSNPKTDTISVKSNKGVGPVVTETKPTAKPEPGAQASTQPSAEPQTLAPSLKQDSVLAVDAFLGSRLQFCEAVEGGKPVGIDKQFDISPKGGYIFVAVTHDKPMNLSKITAEVYKKTANGYTEKLPVKEHTVDAQGHFAAFKQVFKQPGDYKIELYAPGNVWINSGFVHISVAK